MTDERLQLENDELRRRLVEAQETLDAIRSGAVDAFVVEGAEGSQVYTLEGADRPYRILVEQMQQGAVTLDETGIIVYCNVRLANLAGIPHEQLIGTDFRNLIAAAERPQYEGLLEQALTGNGQGESILQTANGTSIPVFLTLNTLPSESGVCTGVLVTDLTAQRHHEKLDALLTQLRESEGRFRQLADAIPQLAWTADQAGNIDWYNNRWYEYTGTTFDEMRGWGWQKIHDPNVLPRVLQRWRTSLDSGQPFEMVFPMRGANGSFRVFLTKVMPFCDSSGQTVRWFGTSTDISEQQTLQDELRRTATELSDADRRKDEFLATLAHELRNPLSPIKTATQLMQMIDGEAAQYRELSGVIDRQVNQMVRLIDDLLDVSRISRGKITLQAAPCELRDVVANALESAQPFIAKAGHALHIETLDETMCVWGDSARLAQILVNLLNNAAKYTPSPGEIWLTVTRENGNALIQVRDNGVGILASQLSMVFEMFEQLDIDKQRGQAGLGIGLSLVKTLVELHGGEVTAESEGRGCGSRFNVRLPLLSDHVPTAEKADNQVATQGTSRPFRVLVVEDMKANRFMLVRLLRTMGHEVAEAANGREGIEKALSFEPDVILSDISMPIMNGYEMAKELRANRRLNGVQLVALTGYGQEADRQDATTSGFDGHIVKPVDVTVLNKFFAELSTGQSRTKPR